MLPSTCFSLVLLLCLAMSGVHAFKCPRDWIPYNNHCYAYFPQEMSWRQAQAHCQRHKANLASILDTDEHHAVADYLRRAQYDDDEDVWIGLHIPTRSQAWVWADSSPVGYTAWERFKPSHFAKNEHCALLDEDSGFMVWDNDSCNDRNAFLCKL